MMNKIFIGDNLRIMNSSKFHQYIDKIRFIYIDPPYNTNNSFAYNDSNDTWADDISDRLKIARELMTSDGVIFISIDDNEMPRLVLLCEEIFGKNNYVGLFITKQAQRSNAKHINIIHEYVLCFAKDKKKLQKFYIKRLENPLEADLLKSMMISVKKAYNSSKKEGYDLLKKLTEEYVQKTGETWIKNYSSIDSEGNVFFGKDLSTPGKPCKLEIPEIAMYLDPLPTRGWSSKEKILKLYKEKRLSFKNNRPYEIEYLYEATNNVSSILDFYSRFGTNDLKKMGLDGLFDTPKPVELIKFLIRCSQHDDSIILDFYAGSGTTAQAVYEVNQEDKMHHQYVLIQLNEPINVKNDAYEFLIKRGFKNPTVDQATLLRIDTYLQLNNLEKDYDVEVID